MRHYKSSIDRNKVVRTYGNYAQEIIVMNYTMNINNKYGTEQKKTRKRERKSSESIRTIICINSQLKHFLSSALLRHLSARYLFSLSENENIDDAVSFARDLAVCSSTEGRHEGNYWRRAQCDVIPYVQSFSTVCWDDKFAHSARLLD